MVRLNLTRGLLRLWVAATVAWLGVVAFFAWDEVSIATRGKWQFAMELRESGDPDAAFSKGKTFLEVFRKPSEHTFPPSFTKLEYRYEKAWDEDVAKGGMVLVDFPDSSALYVNTVFEKSEQQVVARRFWESRWSRRWEALTGQGWLPWVALVPPFAMLLLGFVVRWIARGFRTASSC